MADVVVAGGSIGGCMAALATARMGLKVILTEETDWIGGQLTNQAVPPDEHPWIEEFGCTQTYREFRERVRLYYKTNYSMTREAMENAYLNPGNGWVSRLAHEPKVALKVIEDMLAPYINSGRLQILYHIRPVEANMTDDIVQSITFKQIHSGEKIELNASYFLDATECGDVLPIAGVEYVTGAESKKMTGEPHALDEADPLDMQAFTYVFAVDYIEGGNFTIEKPEQYDFWSEYIPNFSKFPLLSWFSVNVHEPNNLREFTMFPNEKGIPALFTYRRIIDVKQIEGSLYEGDISLINWAQNDYFLGPIYEVSEEERKKHLYEAKQLSLSLLYWLQTEAPHLDGGGKGFPGLRLRKDVLGTEDGLAKYPYIRESRRIKAVYTISEKDVSKEIRGTNGICRYFDSVGVGSYHLDLHHTSVSHRNFYIPTFPYEIPLGALLPVRVKNLLPACKNIGTTQVTNGCYRLHPTEWNIGESVGYLASYAILNQVTPHTVREQTEHLQAFQNLLERYGVQLHWPDHMEL